MVVSSTETFANSGSSVVVDSLFIVAPIVLWGFVYCFVVQYLMSFLVLHSSR